MTSEIIPPACPGSKDPGFSALLSLVFAGLGQAYNGQVARGLFILAATLAGGLGFAPAGVAFWLYGTYDAYATAKRMNEGTIPYHESSIPALLLLAAVWTAGVLLLPAVSGAPSWR